MLNGRLRWKQRHTWPASDGFTLIEIMVATLLLALVLLPMLGVFIASVSVASKSETENTASLLAQEQIEEIRGLTYDAMALDSAKIDAQSGITGSPPVFTYAGAEYDVVAETGGAVSPVSNDLKRRNSFYDVRRYILWAPNKTEQDYKKIVIVVSWDKPQPGSMTYETDAQKVGLNDAQPPVVVGTYPYIGDAFRFSSEIGEATATATDADGTPVKVRFEYKKNVEATFSHVGTDTSGEQSPRGYDFSTTWGATLSVEAQYNMRVIVTDDDGLTGTETHPFFIDTTPPLPPASSHLSPPVWITDVADAPCDPEGAAWPLVVNWNPVRDYIDGNTNFNMVIGYLIYRDERPYVLPPPEGGEEPTTTTSTTEGPILSSALVAAVYGSEVSKFYDATAVSEFSDTATEEPLGTEVRYRIKSLGRAAYWRGPGLGELGEVATGWYKITTSGVGSGSPPSPVVLAEPASWSAVNVTLTWPSSASPPYTLYLVYRAPGETEDYLLVGTMSDLDGGAGELIFKDDNLTRNSSYTYRVVPVSPSGYPPSGTGVLSNSVTTSLY